MNTITETAPTRNLHSVNDRRSHQCARPGWRLRRGSRRQLATDIADAIRRHRSAGDVRYTEPHDFTPNAETQAMVQQLLNADAQL